jgi:hypothetical protein
MIIYISRSGQVLQIRPSAEASIPPNGRPFYENGSEEPPVRPCNNIFVLWSEV